LCLKKTNIVRGIAARWLSPGVKEKGVRGNSVEGREKRRQSGNKKDTAQRKSRDLCSRSKKAAEWKDGQQKTCQVPEKNLAGSGPLVRSASHGLQGGGGSDSEKYLY